ncbi:MAG: 5-formyltetrahydrofolate cyclo-ligase, partial [Ruminiclostridium sp.]|nr:5-formyltetrahydrofolate cyclo-ligase [Ruminiclostridium sp.]
DEITDFKETVCITPALSFDNDGYRLGYGGGFYDRFFEKFDGISVGICYDSFIGSVPKEEYDRSVDILVTESGIRYMRK